MSLVLFALLATTTLAMHELNHQYHELEKQDPGTMKVGHCPYKPGALRSKVDNFNFTELAGIWKVVYDENSMRENFTCPGVRFDPYDNKPADHKSDAENNYLT